MSIQYRLGAIIFIMGAVLISIPFILSFALEGIGITFNRSWFLWFYVASPSLFYLILLIRKRQDMRVPKPLGALSLLLFALALISSIFFSVDKQKSVEMLLFSAFLFLLFLASYNYKALALKAFSLAVGALGIFFPLYSAALASSKWLGFRLPQVLHEKQVVSAYYPPHNHLGDFLGLSLVFILTWAVGKRKPLLFYLGLGILFIIMLLSGSRSSYAAFALVMAYAFWRERYSNSKKMLLVWLLALVAAVSFFAAVSLRFTPEISPLFPVKTFVSNTLGITPRDVVSGRNVYFSAAINTIKEKPFFGIGGGSYISASLAYTTKNDYSDSAHNIFLETAAEQGMPAFILYGLIISMLAVAALKLRSPSSYAFLFLLVNFQTDYTYQIYLFLVAAAVLAGIYYEEKNPQQVPVSLYGFSCLILFSAAIMWFTSSFLLNIGEPLKALRWYPLNKTAYIEAFKGRLTTAEADRLSRQALRIAPQDTGIVLAVAGYDETHNRKKEALAQYEALYRSNKLINFQVIWSIYNLKKETESAVQARTFLKQVVANYRHVFSPYGLRKELADTCSENLGKDVCEETGWYK